MICKHSLLCRKYRHGCSVEAGPGRRDPLRLPPVPILPKCYWRHSPPIVSDSGLAALHWIASCRRSRPAPPRRHTLSSTAAPEQPAGNAVPTWLVRFLDSWFPGPSRRTSAAKAALTITVVADPLSLSCAVALHSPTDILYRGTVASSGERSISLAFS